MDNQKVVVYSKRDFNVNLQSNLAFVIGLANKLWIQDQNKSLVYTLRK
jgi:hypothetical protein